MTEPGPTPNSPDTDSDRPSNFIQEMIRRDLASGKHQTVRTRFPPEPNGYLHIGHAKSICLNFGLAEQFDGTCNLRFDDSNPLTEDPEYVESIQHDVRWLGFDWEDRLYHASDYFERLYGYAVDLIEGGVAYVDSQTEQEIRTHRGTVTEAGVDSPYRGRSVEENLDLFRRMRAGEFADGEHVLRAKADMASPNMKMRDPLLYRIRHADHYRSGDAWCIYPLYDFTHCLSDSIEQITHSLCTLEFENNREIYDWVLDHLEVPQPQPRQTEFARLKINYTVLSKRKLKELVEDDHVAGWDDPRMPTISGLRRRGYTPSAIRSFCDRIGVAKANSTVDVGLLEHAIRDDLNRVAPRVMAVLRPLKVTLQNYPEGQVEELEASYWPHDVPREGSRSVPFSRTLFIDRDDFREDPPARFKRLAPGREVRLRYGYIIRCQEVVKDSTGEVTELRCTYDPESRGGTAADGRKVRGTIHWVEASRSRPAEVRLYDRLFADENPDRGKAGEDFKTFLNPDSLEVLTEARVEPSLGSAAPGDRFQFERLGYFYLEPEDSRPDRPVFNRIVTLRDTWAKLNEPEPVERRTRSVEPLEVVVHDPRAGLGPEQLAELDRWVARYGLSDADARILLDDAPLGAFFGRAAADHPNPVGIANWVINELRRELKERDLEALPFAAEELGHLVDLIDQGQVTSAAAKRVFSGLLAGEGTAAEIVRDRGLARLEDGEELARIVDGVLAEAAPQVAAYRAGKSALFGFFVGQVMKASRGRANPQEVSEALRQRLDEET